MESQLTIGPLNTFFITEDDITKHWHPMTSQVKDTDHPRLKYRTPVGPVKAEDYSWMSLLSIPVKVHCYASLHSNIPENLWSHDAGKAWHRGDYITQTTNILQIHVLVLSLHIIWHDLRSAFHRCGGNGHLWIVFSLSSHHGTCIT